MKWFGTSWGAPVCERDADHVEVPVGARCMHCEENMLAGERGVCLTNAAGFDEPVHIECFIRTTAGSVGHQQRTCPCYGGKDGDPPGATTREAARAAFQYFLAHGTEDPERRSLAVPAEATRLVQERRDRHWKN